MSSPPPARRPAGRAQARIAVLALLLVGVGMQPVGAEGTSPVPGSNRHAESAMSLAELRRQATSTNVDERLAAARALKPYGSGAVEPLFTLLEDPAPGVRWAALGSLAGLENVNLTPHLVRALPHAGGRMQVRLYFLLARHADRETWPVLYAGLTHANPLVGRACAEGLAHLARPGDEASLDRALRTATPAIALSLTYGLQRLCTPDAVEALAHLLTRTDAVYRQYGAQSLAECGTPAAVGHLMQHLDDPAAEVQSWAYYGLSVHGGLETLDALLAGAGHADPYVRKECVWGLGRLGDPRGAATVQAALGDPAPEVRRNAAEALGMFGDVEALPALRAAADDPQPSVQLLVAEAMLRLGDPSATPVLIQNLRHDNRHYRDIALRGLTLYSGASHGTDYDAWAAWWAETRQTTTSARPEESGS